MATTILDELLVALGYEYDPKEVKQFQDDLNSLVGFVKDVTKVVVGATVATVGFAVATSKATDEQGKMADEIGVSVEMLDALEFANKRAGGSAEGLDRSLAGLAKRIGEAVHGAGEGAAVFGMMGIEVTDAAGKVKQTDQIFGEIASSFDKFSKAEQIAFAEKLGLTDSIRLLQQGKAGLNDLIAEAQAFGTTTAEDAALAAEFQDSLTDIFAVIKSGARIISRALLPVLNKAADAFTEWWKTNREIIEQNMPLYIERLVFIIKALSVATAAFIALRLASLLGQLITLFRGVSIWALAAGGAIALIPALVGAILAGIALLAEDAKVFFEGGDSFIGNMLEKYPQWKEELTAIAAVFATLFDLTMMIFDGWGRIIQLFTSGTFLEDFSGVAKEVWKDLQAIFNEGKEWIANWAEDIFDTAIENIRKEFIRLGEDIKKLFSFSGLKETFQDLFGTAQKPELPSLPDGQDYTISFSPDSDVPIVNYTKNMNPNGSPDNGAPLNNVWENFAKDSKAQDTNNPESSAAAYAQNTFTQNDTNISNSSATKQVHVNGGINIKVDGSKSPAQTANVIKNELDLWIQQSTIEMSSPVDL